jgi:hypothetical protein
MGAIFAWSARNWVSAAERVVDADGEIGVTHTWLGAAFRAAVVGIPGAVESDHGAVVRWVEEWPAAVLAASVWITPPPKTILWWGRRLGPGSTGWKGWIDDLLAASLIPYASSLDAAELVEKENKP